VADHTSSTETGKTALRVLITRPVDQARALARMLEALGHEVLIEPLLTIEPLDAVPDLDRVQAIAVTSANAAPALGPARHLPVFAVGDASAAAARRAGCARVEAAGGDGPSLARLIVTACRPADGAILHLCGTEVRPGLAEPLAQAGFRFVRHPVYRARVAEAISARSRAALRQGVDGVMLFSPRTAGTFAVLAMQHGLDRHLGDTEAWCLSAAIADACRGLSWRRVRIAARPDQAALVELLEAAGRRC
jgi:uroporphyrinogen-III synthase